MRRLTVEGARKLTANENGRCIGRDTFRQLVRDGVVPSWRNPLTGHLSIPEAQFLAWLDRHGETREQFSDAIETSEDTEGLTIYPNTNYTVMHDLQRVSPPPVSIKSPSSADDGS